MQLKRGIKRQLVIILDASESMNEKDTTLTRMEFVQPKIEEFSKAFLKENPLSRISLIITQNSESRVVSPLTSRPIKFQVQPEGHVSYQNSLLTALRVLRSDSASKEVLIIFSSFTSCDPFDINETIREMVDKKVRCSFVSLTGELKILRKLVNETEGEGDIALDVHHFDQILTKYLVPPYFDKNISSLMEMGFPQLLVEESACACHSVITKSGNICPKCKSKVCDLPRDCPICLLPLIEPHNLQKSLIHSTELQFISGDGSCCCCSDLGDVMCIFCSTVYCGACHSFVKDSLFFCPNCNPSF